MEKLNHKKTQHPFSLKHDTNQRSLVYGLIGGAVGTTIASILFFYTPISTMQHIQKTQPTTTNTSTVTTQPAAITNTSTPATDAEVTNAVNIVQEAVVSVVNYQRSAARHNSFSWLQNKSNALVKAGEGSGVIYKTEQNASFIVTNNHVIENADEINVILKDGTTVNAELVGTDKLTDLAVLKINSEKVTKVATFADSNTVQVGQTALAIGSPLGSKYASTVTKGIISAVNRSVEVDTNDDNQPDWAMTTLQTDAAINPGNSGGALVDLSGNVIGINSMKISNTSVEGIGFAIPSNQVVNIINTLEHEGKITRPYLGVSLVDLSAVSASQHKSLLGLPADINQGVVISYIQPRSSADQAGLKENDVIVAWNNNPVNDSISLRQHLYEQKIGDTVTIDVYRNGTLEKITMTMIAQNSN